jgi:general secretion pathway protein F
LLRAGARINDGLELLAADKDFGRLRPVVADIQLALSSPARALPRRWRGTRGCSGDVCRADPGRRSLRLARPGAGGARRRAHPHRGAEAQAWGGPIRYPLFVLAAAGCVLLFFLTFVLPQFASVLQDFARRRFDPFILGFLNFSTFLRANSDAVLAITAA